MATGQQKDPVPKKNALVKEKMKQNLQFLGVFFLTHGHMLWVFDLLIPFGCDYFSNLFERLFLGGQGFHPFPSLFCLLNHDLWMLQSTYVLIQSI